MVSVHFFSISHHSVCFQWRVYPKGVLYQELASICLSLLNQSKVFTRLKCCCYRLCCHRRVKLKGHPFKVMITNGRGNVTGMWHSKKKKPTKNLKRCSEPQTLLIFLILFGESSVSKTCFPPEACSIQPFFPHSSNRCLGVMWLQSLPACTSSNSQFITSLHFFVCVFIKVFWGLHAEGIYLVIYFTGSTRSFPHNVTSVIGLVANVIVTVHDFSPSNHPDWFFQNVNLILVILSEIFLSPLNICAGSCLHAPHGWDCPSHPDYPVVPRYCEGEGGWGVRYR